MRLDLPAILCAVACAPPPTESTPTTPLPTPTTPTDAPPNLLVVIADDVGVTPLRATWPDGPSARTPTIDRLAAAGVRFPNAYANPTCTPTRFGALTGRYGRRRGIGRPLLYDDPREAPGDEVTLAQRLAPAGYTSIALGKWHLSTEGSPTAHAHPRTWGFEHHGFLQRLDYTDYLRADDGEVSIDPRYQTTALADDLVLHANAAPEPWLIWAGALAAHVPLHVPPDPFNPDGLTEASPPLDMYHAMIEALDTELGRALDGIDPAIRERTIVVFMGDNGTPLDHIPSTWVPVAGKGSVYEGGTRIPLFVSGPGIPVDREHHGLVQVVDLFPTLLELAGIDPSLESVSTATHWDAAADGIPEPWFADWTEDHEPTVIDGLSFAHALVDPDAEGARPYVYSERFWPSGPPPWPNDRVAVHDGQFKLADQDGVVGLYDLRGRMDDGDDLLASGAPLSVEAIEAWDRLTAVLAAHREALVYEP